MIDTVGAGALFRLHRPTSLKWHRTFRPGDMQPRHYALSPKSAKFGTLSLALGVEQSMCNRMLAIQFGEQAHRACGRIHVDRPEEKK
jgi:hypothetical protein